MIFGGGWIFLGKIFIFKKGDMEFLDRFFGGGWMFFGRFLGVDGVFWNIIGEMFFFNVWQICWGRWIFWSFFLGRMELFEWFVLIVVLGMFSLRLVGCICWEKWKLQVVGVISFFEQKLWHVWMFFSQLFLRACCWWGSGCIFDPGVHSFTV